MNLESIKFGERVAENESSELAKYFIETEQWNSLYSGDVDVIFGAKGTGKSALYTLLNSKSEEFLERNISLISAENTRGLPIFSEISNHPPETDHEFVALWKIYLAQLIINKLQKNSQCNGVASDIEARLVEAKLIEGDITLKRLIIKAKTFAKRLTSFDSVEGSVNLEGATGKITFKTPTEEQYTCGYLSIDEVLESLNQHLIDIGHSQWLLFDRLDMSFDDNPTLEKIALKALFKVYRDIEPYDRIHLKIFLRDDIWKRITAEGFREASHITRTTTISWNSRKLLNLIVLRAIDNPEIVQHYNIDVQAIKNSHELQNKLYYKMFPQQVDIGSKQSETFDWVTNRVRDGLQKIAPRELIHIYNEMIEQEKTEQDLGNHKVEDPNLISRQAIKQSCFEVSKAKVEQNLLAEYPEYREYLNKLHFKKASQTLLSLKEIWECSEEEAATIANGLVEQGFFEQRPARNEGVYKIPFLFRPYLNITQGEQVIAYEAE